ncbi:MAG TPA: hypothetical protein VK629_01290 [Steroidobacteraceae bacterium]|nr:hypothetical protein [Steroidobacteraceae bacterium]
MKPKTAYRISLAAGLAVLLLTIVSVLLPPPTLCGGLREGYAPIVAFELARSVADLQALFGAQEGVCRGGVVAAMDRVNWIDVFLYIPFYGSFLIFFFIGARSGTRPRLALWAVSIVAISCLADYVENFWLFRITEHPDFEAGLFGLAVYKHQMGGAWNRHCARRLSI